MYLIAILKGYAHPSRDSVANEEDKVLKIW